MHGGVKFYRGSPGAARSYVEADRSRVDDYYLAEGTGLATRYVATPTTEGRPQGERPEAGGVRNGGTLDGPAYEQWVAGYDVDTGRPKGRLRTDERGLRFVEVVVNGPKTWSLAATLHPEIAAAYDAAQDKAATEIIGWLADHATTRVGPRGRQVQVPVEQLEAAVVRHYTSRRPAPSSPPADQRPGLRRRRMARTALGRSGGQHRGHQRDRPRRRDVRSRIPPSARHPRLHPRPRQQRGRPARAVRRSVQRTHRADQQHRPLRGPVAQREPRPGTRPEAADGLGPPRLVRSTSGQGRPQGRRRAPPAMGRGAPRPRVHSPSPRPSGQHRHEPRHSDRQSEQDAVVDLALTRLGARRSSWNAADIRGEIERIITSVDIVATTAVRHELAEDLTARAVHRCEPLLERDDVPDHVRSLTSRHVLAVEADLVTRLAAGAGNTETPGRRAPLGSVVAGRHLDPAQREVVAALTGTHRLLVIEGAAGAGKTTTLAAARDLLESQDHRLIVITPTLKAARVAEQQVGVDAFSAAWLIHQHGFRWDDDGYRSRAKTPRAQIDARARLLPGDVLLVDEAGMLDQDTAHAVLTIADEAGARISFVGDRHQLPAVGRGGVLDHAARWTSPDTSLELDTVHRFSDPEYADLTLLMRTGQRAGEVFNALLDRGQITIHPTDVERLAALAELSNTDRTGSLVIADTREQVSALNAAIRDHRTPSDASAITTDAGEQIGAGDRVATRRNDRELDVANRDTWTVTSTAADGSLTVRGRAAASGCCQLRTREHTSSWPTRPPSTAPRARPSTAPTCSSARPPAQPPAYVCMTRGRNANTAYLVAENVDEARAQWIATFSRDRADLGPAHAAQTVADDIDRYGPQPRRRTGWPAEIEPEPAHEQVRRPPDPVPLTARPPGRLGGIGR